MSRCLALLVAFLAAASATPNPAAPPEDPAPAIEAFWIEHRITFDYLGFTTAYACDSLREKLIDLLRLAGARRDIKVTTSGCAESSLRVSMLLHARMHFHSPALAKPDVSSSTLPVVPAMAHWSSVQITPGHPQSLARGDCELIEQFQHQVLKNFEVRNIESSLRCVPHQLPSGDMHLDFEALTGTKTSEAESIEFEKHREKRDNEMKSDRKPAPKP